MGAPHSRTKDHFVIVVRGAAGKSTRAALEDVDISVGADTTVMRCEDQAALHGLFQRIQALGLEIIEVHHEPKELA